MWDWDTSKTNFLKTYRQSPQLRLKTSAVESFSEMYNTKAIALEVCNNWLWFGLSVWSSLVHMQICFCIFCFPFECGNYYLLSYYCCMRNWLIYSIVLIQSFISYVTRCRFSYRNISTTLLVVLFHIVWTQHCWNIWKKSTRVNYSDGRIINRL